MEVRQTLTQSLRFLLMICLVIGLPSGCSWLAGGNVVDSATVVYTKGSKKHTAAVQIPVTASEVFSAIARLLERNPDITIDNRNDQAFLIEVSQGSRSLTGQVSSLGIDHSLLYVWADAGESGLTGEDLAISVVERVCDELGVVYELVHY